MPKILYNVTVIIDDSVRLDWKQWMIDIHIPEVMATGCFESYQMQRILTEGSEGGTTYAIQYLAPDIDTYQRYQAEHAGPLQQDHERRYKGKYGSFRTLMEVVSAG